MKKSFEPVSEVFKKAQLPIYQEIFKNLAPFSLFCHPRMTGKSFNLVLGLMALAIEKGKNVCFSRLWEESLHDSLWREVVDKIQRFSLESYFKVTRNQITFKPKNIQFFFRALSNYESFKGLQGVSLLYIDEVQQINQEIMQLVVPSIRGEDKKIILSGNLPANGQAHWLYKTFYVNPLPSYQKYEVKQEENIVSFPHSQDLQRWREDQKAFFRGREKDYEREILGLWSKLSYSRIFPYFQRQRLANPVIDVWLYHYSQGMSLWLGVAFDEQEVRLVEESFLPVPISFRRCVPVWISSHLGCVIKTFKSYGFKVRPKREGSVEELAHWFSQTKLIVNDTLSLAGEDLSSLSWQRDLDKPSAPALGLVSSALTLLLTSNS